MLEVICDLGMKYPNRFSKRKRRYVKAKCHCGVELAIRKDLLKTTQSCGCVKTQLKHDIPIGETYGKLTILEDLGVKGKHRERYIKVTCSCNGVPPFEAMWRSVKKGLTTSCGCSRKKSNTIPLDGEPSSTSLPSETSSKNSKPKVG